MKKSAIIYQLTVEDIQTVAYQEIERNLSIAEIELIKDKIAEKINWYDAITDSINENVNPKETASKYPALFAD